MANILESIQLEKLKTNVPDFKAGDTVRVHVKIREGEKERVQIFEGVVLRRRGVAIESSFTVRKVSYGVGVERIFPTFSPLVDKIEIVSRGKVRRAKLYYLRDLSGKKARLVSDETFRTSQRQEAVQAKAAAAAAAPVVAETK